MPLYSYTALKSGKDKVSGKIEAQTLKDAREALRKMNLVPTKIQEQAEKAAKTSSGRKTESGVKLKKLSMREKIDFTNTLYVLSKTGISIIEALLFVELNSSSKNSQVLATELKKSVMLGANLSESINRYPETFDPIYSGLIKAGEESGELDTTLERMMFLLEKQDRLRSKVIATMAYPCFIIVLAILVTLVMLTFVFPAFKDMYDNMGKELPLITKVLMDLGIFLKTYWYVPILGGLTSIYALYFLLTWPGSRKVIDDVMLKIPVVKVFVQLASLSNFISVLRVSFDAGVPIVDSLLLANLTVQNYVYKRIFRETATKIQHGQSLSSSLKQTELIPGVVMCMISTGEQSGQLGDMLEQSSIYIDTQLERTVDLLNKLFEPILLVVVGGIVLVLALALYLPLFQSYSNMM